MIVWMFIYKTSIIKMLNSAKEFTSILVCHQLLFQNILIIYVFFTMACIILMYYVLHTTLWTSTKQHADMLLLNTGLRTHLKYIYFNRTSDRFQISLTFQNCKLSPKNCDVILEWWTESLYNALKNWQRSRLFQLAQIKPVI